MDGKAKTVRLGTGALSEQPETEVLTTITMDGMNEKRKYEVGVDRRWQAARIMAEL
jgi:hypothetical protein